MARWVPTTGCHIPNNAIRGGYEADGRPLYVARAYFQGEWTPGKAGCHISGCHLPYGGKEHSVNEFEVLVLDIPESGFYEWKHGCEGQVPSPDDALCLNPCYAYYVARAFYADSLIPGKLHTSHGCTYVAYGGKEYSVREYDVLCRIK